MKELNWTCEKLNCILDNPTVHQGISYEQWKSYFFQVFWGSVHCCSSIFSASHLYRLWLICEKKTERDYKTVHTLEEKLCLQIWKRKPKGLLHLEEKWYKITLKKWKVFSPSLCGVKAHARHSMISMSLRKVKHWTSRLQIPNFYHLYTSKTRSNSISKQMFLWREFTAYPRGLGIVF